MKILETGMKQLRQDNPELAEILDVYAKIEQVYSQAQNAMGAGRQQPTLEVRNSADTALVFNPDTSTSTTSWKEQKA